MAIAVFLDRDGTLNEEMGYIRDVGALRLIPGAARAVRRLNDAGFYAILTTNQTGPARGYYSEDHVKALNQRVADLLAQETGARLDAVFYCPHLPNGAVAKYARPCDCRKPGTGMIDAACAQFADIDVSQSYVVGDKATDVEFGQNAGAHSILLKTGYGQQVLDGTYQTLKMPPTQVCEDIAQAVGWILAQPQPVKTQLHAVSANLQGSV